MNSRTRQASSRWRLPLAAALAACVAAGCSPDAAPPGTPDPAGEPASSAAPERSSAAGAIAREPIDDPDLLEDLAALEAAQDTEELLDALSTVVLSADERAIPYLAPLVRHADRAVAVEALASIELLAVGTTAGVPVLREAMLWDLAPEVKQRVIEALYEQRTEGLDDEVREAILLGLADARPAVRAEAAAYVGMLGDSQAEPALRDHLSTEPDPAVRAAIEWALAFLADETDAPPPSGPAAPAESATSDTSTADPPATAGSPADGV